MTGLGTKAAQDLFSFARPAADPAVDPFLSKPQQPLSRSPMASDWGLVGFFDRDSSLECNRKAQTTEPGPTQSPASGSLKEEATHKLVADFVKVYQRALEKHAAGHIEVQQAQQAAIQQILRQARKMRQQAVAPQRVEAQPWVSGADGECELAFEEMLEQGGLAGAESGSGGELWVEVSEERERGLILCVDASLSMRGEKLALTAVALAVILQDFYFLKVGLVIFQHQAKTIQVFNQRLSPAVVVRQFLELASQGYTDLEQGLKAGLRMLRAARQKERGLKVSLLLVTDGQYTAGRNPIFLAASCAPLSVLQLVGSSEGSKDQGLCLELARRGLGQFSRVDHLPHLPQGLKAAVKVLLK